MIRRVTRNAWAAIAGAGSHPTIAAGETASGTDTRSTGAINRVASTARGTCSDRPTIPGDDESEEREGTDCGQRNGDDQRHVAEGRVARRIGKHGIDEAEKGSDRERPEETLAEVERGSLRGNDRDHQRIVVAVGTDTEQVAPPSG